MARLGALLVQANGIGFARDLVTANLPRIRQAESGAGESLADLMAQDFRSDRTVVVQGIIFSAIEATQFAMAAFADGVAA